MAPMKNIDLDLTFLHKLIKRFRILIQSRPRLQLDTTSFQLGQVMREKNIILNLINLLKRQKIDLQSQQVIKH